MYQIYHVSICYTNTVIKITGKTFQFIKQSLTDSPIPVVPAATQPTASLVCLADGHAAHASSPDTLLPNLKWP